MIKELNFGCYGGNLALIYGETDDSVAEHFRVHSENWARVWEACDDVKGAYAWASQRRVDDRLYHIVCFSEPMEKDDASVIIIAHECVHLCQFFLGTVLDRNVEVEAEAYLHSHLMRQVIDAIYNE